jgi:hypothetical protein
MTVRRSSLRRNLWFLAGLCLCGPAFGQTAPRIEISPTIGYLYGGNLFDSSAEPFSVSVGDHLDYGLRVGWLASPRWAFEFDWTRVPTKLVFRTPLDPQPPISLDIDYLTPRVAYHFATGAIRPYVAGGLGGAIFDMPTGSDGYFTVTFAAGVKAFLTPSLGVRVEARGFATGVGDPPLGSPCTTFVIGPDEEVVPVSCAHEWILNGDVTAGIVVAF